ncbi:hypothetical protein D9M71_613380 [compost metagenome]
MFEANSGGAKRLIRCEPRGGGESTPPYVWSMARNRAIRSANNAIWSTSIVCFVELATPLSRIRLPALLLEPLAFAPLPSISPSRSLKLIGLLPTILNKFSPSTVPAGSGLSQRPIHGA